MSSTKKLRVKAKRWKILTSRFSGLTNLLLNMPNDFEGSEEDAGFETTSSSGNSDVYFNYHRQQDLENALRKGEFVVDHIKLQDYHEPDGSITTDMIIIAKKKKLKSNIFHET